MRYFFDIRDGSVETRDEEGCELETEIEMQRAARRILAEIAGDEARIAPSSQLMARVRNSHGETVYRAVLTLEGQPL
jgi:hypothetical protein